MADGGLQLVIGLMSGTSMDGVDAAVLGTDGDAIGEKAAFLSVAYPEAFRARLRCLVGAMPEVYPEAEAVARELTLFHADVVHRLIAENGYQPGEVELIGFHGHTVFHDPDNHRTCQIGDGDLLAQETGIDVIDNFRAADVAAGGQGAPLAPVYHVALARDLERPVAILNVGGVANLTWISPDGGAIAFDTGPGNALIDDWVRQTGNLAFDEGGRLARDGYVYVSTIKQMMDHQYFDRPAPKSLDRDAFSLALLQGATLEDGAATLTAFTAEAVANAVRQLPAPPLRWLVTGGGRRNQSIMAALRTALQAPVEPVEAVGWNGDAIEAEAFAFLAARSLRGLPLSFPQTTGVAGPMTGGILHQV